MSNTNTAIPTENLSFASKAIVDQVARFDHTSRLEILAHLFPYASTFQRNTAFDAFRNAKVVRCLDVEVAAILDNGRHPHDPEQSDDEQVEEFRIEVESDGGEGSLEADIVNASREAVDEFLANNLKYLHEGARYTLKVTKVREYHPLTGELKLVLVKDDLARTLDL